MCTVNLQMWLCLSIVVRIGLAILELLQLYELNMAVCRHLGFWKCTFWLYGWKKVLLLYSVDKFVPIEQMVRTLASRLAIFEILAGFPCCGWVWDICDPKMAFSCVKLRSLCHITWKADDNSCCSIDSWRWTRVATPLTLPKTCLCS